MDEMDSYAAETPDVQESITIGEFHRAFFVSARLTLQRYLCTHFERWLVDCRQRMIKCRQRSPK